ncbi:hypothetical protein [Verrucomicrobium sp. GAS474]|uniref:hypothetical protein n=1 Tax=Verrucomicrobium sp. GAS474 TaxID=1882831 RepID=UPI000B874993|nr:hypothetical protein [Verrucomicrobium sp. GAS474]
MWDEVQLLIEEFVDAIPDNPVVLGVLATFGIGVEFIGDACHDASFPARRLPVAHVTAALLPEEGSSRASVTATPAPSVLRTESPVPHTA